MRNTIKMAALAVTLTVAALAATVNPAVAATPNRTSHVTTASARPITPDSLTSAARSTEVYLQNHTVCYLVLKDYGLYSGIWSYYPPNQITPSAGGVWGSESSGLFTGTAGYATYFIENCGWLDEFTIYWNNPYVGSNSYSISQPSYYWVKQVSGGSGDNAVVTFSLGYTK